MKRYIIKKISPIKKKFHSEFLTFNGINHELIDVEDNIPKLNTQVVRGPRKNENSTMYFSGLLQSRSKVNNLFLQRVYILEERLGK